MTEEVTREERWVCAGVRVFEGSKRMMAWQRPEETGRLRYFDDKGVHWVTGGIYRVSVSDGEEGRVIRHGEPSYVALHGDEELRAQLRAEEHAAKAALEALARERRDAKSDALEDAMLPLLRIAGKMRTRAQRDAFTAHVINRLNQAWWSS